MAKRGQPTKLTPELQEKICAIITQTGCSVEGAAAACDVTGRSLYEWKARGLLEGKGPYFQFAQAIMRAKEKAEPTLAACIAKAAKEDWRAAAWMLERRFPERYGNQVTIIRRFEQMTEDELDAYIAGRLRNLDRKTKMALALRLEQRPARQTANLDNRPEVSFADFITKVFPGYEFARFHQFLVAKLEDFLHAVERRESPRLALSVPPRHGKSQCASILLPAYALGRNPDWPIIHASYTADLSHDFSRAVRNLLAEPEYQAIFPGVMPPRDSRSVERWGIAGRRGAFVSTGVGGPLMGRGAQLLLVDDPLKNSADADSETFRARQRHWYATTARTRLEKGGGILIIQTRWHLDDLTGYVTEGNGSDEPPAEEWEVVNIPAVAGEGDPLGREPGEPLWPEKYDVAALAAMQRQMPPRWWQALMQGSPVAAEGNLLHVAKIEHRMPPEGARYYQAWDLAISEKTTADWSVGMTIAVDADQNVYLVDEVRGRWGFNDVLEQIAAAAKVWDPASIGIETTAFQAAVFQEASRRYLLPFREVKCDRDKVVRAQLLADRIDGGKVFANKQAPWWRGWEAEARDFPQGGHDDRVDSASHCVRMVSAMPWGADPGMQERLKKMYGMA